MSQELLLTEAISFAADELKKSLKNRNIDFSATKGDFLIPLNDHIKSVKRIVKYITFNELQGSKRLSEVYIDIDIQLQRRSIRGNLENNEKTVLLNIVKTEYDNLIDIEHIVVLGGPGAGKTTSVNNICRKILDYPNNTKYVIPILINLRDLRDNETIYSRLKRILGIEFFIKDNRNTSKYYLEDELKTQDLLNPYLDGLNAVIVLDGLDEVIPTKLDSIYQEIDYLMQNITNSLIILTCRSASIDYKLRNSIEYELCDLNEEQVIEFVNKWFTKTPRKAKLFLTELYSSKFYDLSFRPLALAHLCAVFEKTGKFYEKPRRVYMRLIDLLLEEWDLERNITERESYVNLTDYSKFEPEEKRKFLAQLAYDLSTSNRNKIYKTEDFMASYNRIHDNHNLPMHQMKKVVKEIESHTGIIIKSGRSDFQFFHKSMQEYLAAEYIVKMDTLPFEYISRPEISLSNELAISICEASDTSKSFYRLVFEYLHENDFTVKFILEFLNRFQYERPIIKVSILFPLSIIYIYNLLHNRKLITNDEGKYSEFELRYIELVNLFKKDEKVKISFSIFEKFTEINWSYNTESYKISFFDNMYTSISEYESNFINNCGNLFVSKELYSIFFDKS